MFESFSEQLNFDQTATERKLILPLMPARFFNAHITWLDRDCC